MNKLITEAANINVQSDFRFPIFIISYIFAQIGIIKLEFKQFKIVRWWHMLKMNIGKKETSISFNYWKVKGIGTVAAN